MSYFDKYHLDKSPKKYLCPQCGKKSFVVYLNAETKEPVNEHAFGRCDRENNCSYHVKPDVKVKEDIKTLVVQTLYPSENELKKLQEKPSPLHTFLESKDIPSSFLYANNVYEDRGMTSYVFRNLEGKFCNIKWFKYNSDGNRDKEFTSFSLKQPKQRNQYVEDKYIMPLFGEHELDPEKKRIVCVIESEKTRVIAKFHYPQFDWVACGSANGLSDGTEGSANKIKPLIGRTVYWVCDADPAARGKIMFIEKTGKEEFVRCSSVRNGIKYIDDFHVCDLWPDRTDGYDIGDALLDGLKPEIKPTWSRKQTDIRFNNYLPSDRDHMLIEFTQGKEIGEPGRVDVIDDMFSWKRSFINCWTGWPNDGKSTFFMFMAVVKSVPDNWKWCIWSPEMMNSYREGNKIKITASDIYDELVYMYTGKTPYLHFEKKYGIKQMSKDEYMAALDWVERYFIIVYPKERKYKDIISNFMYFYEYFGCDAYLADPFKSMKQDEGGRTDLYLDDLFYEFKQFAIMSHSSMNFIAHPNSQDEPKKKDGSYKVCTQRMLAGGAAWDNNMDGIYSIYRPNRHKDPRDPRVHFYNLKQRKQQLAGRVGLYDKVEFDWNRNRYYFDGVCPIDGSFKTPVQSSMTFPNGWDKKKKSNGKVTFEEHIVTDWHEPAEKNDDPDFVPF